MFEALEEEADQGTIWTVSADGGEPAEVTTAEDGDCRQPNWSPVDDRIVVQCRPEGEDVFRLVTIAPDGSDLVEVTPLDDDATDASWSPDGERLVYSGAAEGGAGLYAVSADGGDPIRLDDGDSGYDGAPSWSPDGHQIAFESSQSLDEPTVIR